jgi:nucleoside-diphosphate-sugar epimerase
MVSALPSVKVLVTGGGGFLGRYLCQTLLRRKRLNGRALDSIAILDTGADTHVPCDTKVQVFPHGPTNQASSAIRVENYRGDITDRKLVEKAMQPGSEGGHVTIFHLASVMSGEGEEEFDKCVAVNLGEYFFPFFRVTRTNAHVSKMAIDGSKGHPSLPSPILPYRPQMARKTC